ncbi:MAG TPA: hypothetical protein VF497_04365 [Rudaea sp.]
MFEWKQSLSVGVRLSRASRENIDTVEPGSSAAICKTGSMNRAPATAKQQIPETKNGPKAHSLVRRFDPETGESHPAKIGSGGRI